MGFASFFASVVLEIHTFRLFETFFLDLRGECSTLAQIEPQCDGLRTRAADGGRTGVVGLRRFWPRHGGRAFAGSLRLSAGVA